MSDYVDAVSRVPKPPPVVKSSGVFRVTFVEGGERVTESFNNEATAKSFINSIENKQADALSKLKSDGVVVVEGDNYVVPDVSKLTDMDKARMIDAGFSVPKTVESKAVDVVPLNDKVAREISGPSSEVAFSGESVSKFITGAADAYENLFNSIPNLAKPVVDSLKSQLKNGSVGEVPALVAATAINFAIGAYQGATGIIRPKSYIDTIKLVTSADERTNLLNYIKANQFDFITQTAGGLVGGYYAGKAVAPIITPIKDSVYTTIFNKLPKDKQFIINPKLAYSKLSFKELFPGEADYGFMDFPETVSVETMKKSIDLVPVDVPDNGLGYSADAWVSEHLYKKGTVSSNVKTLKPSDVKLWDESLAGKPVPVVKGESIRLWGLHEFEVQSNGIQQSLISVQKTKPVLTAKVVETVSVLSDYAHVSGLGSTVNLDAVVTHSNLAGLVGGVKGLTVPILREQLKYQGLNLNQINAVVPILVMPQTLKTLQATLPKLDKQSMLIVAKTLQPDMLTASLDKLKPDIAADVLTQDDFKLISYIVPRLDERTLVKVLVVSDVVVTQAIITKTSTEVMTSVLTKMDVPQITKLLTVMSASEVERIAPNIPADKISKIMPKLVKSKKDILYRFSSKFVTYFNVTYRLHSISVSKRVVASSFIDAFNKVCSSGKPYSSVVVRRG